MIQNYNPLMLRNNGEFIEFANIIQGCAAAIRLVKQHIAQNARRLIRTSIYREVTQLATMTGVNAEECLDEINTSYPVGTIIKTSDKNLICFILFIITKHIYPDEEIHIYWYERAFALA